MDRPNNDPAIIFAHPGSIEALVGTSLVKKKGHSEKDREIMYHVEECTPEEFKHTHKYLAIFFSASWCAPSKTFLAMLKEFYSEVNIDSKQCEVLFVSLDRTEDEFKHYYATMPWLAVPYSQGARAQELRARYRIIGIPQLVVVKSEDGALVTLKGRKDIHEQGVKTIADWNKTVELNVERKAAHKDEETELEALRLKLIQLQLEKTMALQQQQNESAVVIGA